MNLLVKVLEKIRELFYKLYNYWIFRKNCVVLGRNIKIRGLIELKNKGTILIGDNFSVNSGYKFNPIGGDNITGFFVENDAQLRIGNNVGMSNSTIVCWDKITIGDNVVIGGSVKIWDTNFHSLNPVTRVSGNDTDIRVAPITICDNVFIGAFSIILKGVTIGSNSIIAAGSVVTKDLPSNVIAGGNPCNIIKLL